MPDAKGLPVPLAILIGALAGAFGYWAAEQLARRPEPAPGPAAAPAPAPDFSADIDRLDQALTELSARLDKLESKPSLEESLEKPSVRDRLLAIVTEKRPPATATTAATTAGTTTTAGARPDAPAPEAWRRDLAASCRAEYADILQEARGAVGADDAAWAALRPVFERHFGPVEAALRELETGRTASPPRVNALIRPELAATLGALQGALPARAWTAFDAWRKSDAGAVGRYATRGDYFLGGEDYKDFRARHTAAVHWPVLKGELDRFYAQAGLEEAKRRKLEELLRAHLDRICGALRDEERPSLSNPKAMDRVKPIARETEAQIGALLGPDGLARFKEWQTATGSRASYYFGKPPRPWIGDVVTRNESAELFVDVDRGRPNLLVADGQETTEVVYRDLRRRAGLRVQFSVDQGRIETDVKTTDDAGVARATYTADTKTSTATVQARVLDEADPAGAAAPAGAAPLATYVYNEAFNFRDLSCNEGLAGYSDETFVRSDAMTREQIQSFLETRKSFLATYSEGGRSAAEIVKAAADKHGVNPKVILVTLQKEQGLVTRQKPLAAEAPEMRNAMGVRPRLARTFAAQVDAGTRVLRQRFDEPAAFFPIRVKEKYGGDGRVTQDFRDGNHIYVVPSTGDDNIWAPVAFEALNRSTHAQHRYTNFVTHRPDAEARQWPLPCGGVHLFVSTWRKLIGE